MSCQIEFQLNRFHCFLEMHPGSYFVTYDVPICGCCGFLAVMDDFGDLVKVAA